MKKLLFLTALVCFFGCEKTEEEPPCLLIGSWNEYEVENIETGVTVNGQNVITFFLDGIVSITNDGDEVFGYWNGECGEGENFFASFEHSLFNYVILSISEDSLLLSDGVDIGYYANIY